MKIHHFFEGKRPLVDIDLLQNLSHLNFYKMDPFFYKIY